MNYVQKDLKIVQDKLKTPSLTSLYALSLTVFLISDTQGGVGPFISIYLKSFLNFDSGRIGLVLATYNIASFICQIPSGLLIDYVRFKRLLIGMSSTIVGFGCLLIVNSATIIPILVAQTLIGIATSIIPPAIAAITLGLVGRETFPKRLAVNSTFNHAGNVTNTFLTGLMVFWLGVTWILYVDFAFSLASIIPLLFIKKHEIDDEIAREAPENVALDYKPIKITKILSTPIILFYCLSVILFTFANAAQLPLVGQKIANIAPQSGATYMASSIIIAQLTMIGVAFVLSFIINKYGRKLLLVLSFFVLIIRAIFYTLTTNPNLLLSNQVLDGVAAGIFSIVSVVIISDLAKNTGRFNFMQGLMIFCISVGASLSNLVSGYVANVFGIDTGFLMLALVAVVGVTFYSTVMPETKDRYFF